jgi:hypothetical protein
VTTHRRIDPYERSRAAAREQARREPRNARLLQAPSLAAYVPAAALYPLYPENLVLVLLFGALQAGVDAALPEIWLTQLLPCALIVYLLEVVAHTAQGYATAPPFTVDHLTSALGRALPAIFAVLLAVVTILQLEQRDSWPEAFAALALASICLPAVLGLLALRGAWLEAFDPRRWLVCIAAGGYAYAILVAMTAVAIASVVGIAPRWATLLEGLPFASGLVVQTLQVYAVFFAAHLLGAAFHLQRDRLELKVAVRARSDDEADQESVQEAVARVLALADAEEHHGRDPAAVALLGTAPIGSHAARHWLEELFEGACRRPKPYFAETAGQRLVAHLVGEQQWSRALEVVVLAAQRWARFQPAAAADRRALAEQAFERRAALAFRLLTADDGAAGSVAGELAFLAARWRAERDGDEAAARALLAPLLAISSGALKQKVAAYAAALDAGKPRRVT